MTETQVDDDAVQALWRRYCEATGADPSSLDAVERFGDSAQMADELLTLVVEGKKTATAGLARGYTALDEAPSDVGGHWIVLDGRSVPRCVLKTTEIRLGTLNSVDDAFAWDEGEGERTRDWWLDAHRRFFLRQCERDDVPFDEQTDVVVFERFEVVWTQH